MLFRSLLSGHVERPGGYQFRSGMRVSHLLGSTDALLPGADIDFLLIKREDRATLRTQVIYGNLLQAISQPGAAEDILLQPRDQVMVFYRAEDRELSMAENVREIELKDTEYRPARVVQLSVALR